MAEEMVGVLVGNTEGATNIKPKNLNNPWRNGTFSWTWTPAVAGMSNSITYHRIQRNIYRHATSTWDGWVQVKQVGAVTGTQTTTITLDNLNDLDCVRLRIVVVQGTGNNVTTYEAGTWSGISGTHTYQTQNAVPPAPTFVTESPLEIVNNTCNITLSAKDTSTSYFTTSNKKGRLTFTLSTLDGAAEQSATVTDTYTSTFSTTINIYNLIDADDIGYTKNFRAIVSDGFSSSSASDNRYRIGKTLQAPTLSYVKGKILATGTTTGNNIYTLSRDSVKIDGCSITAGATLQASYNSNSNFKDLYTLASGSTYEIDNSKIITDVLGAPSSYNSKVYFRVKAAYSGYTTVYSNVINTTFIWETINLDNITIANRDGISEPRYRYDPTNPIGPCAYSWINFNLVQNQNVHYVIASESTNITTTQNIANANFSVLNMTPGMHNITITSYQTMSGGATIALGTKPFQDAYYKINKSDDVTCEVVANDVNFLTNGSENNVVSFDIKLKSVNYPYRLTSAVLVVKNFRYIKDNLNISIFNTNFTFIPCAVRIKDSTLSGFKPLEEYSVNNIVFNAISQGIMTDIVVPVNATIPIQIILTVKELFSNNVTTTPANYTYINNLISQDYTQIVNCNTICEPNVTNFAVNIKSSEEV